MATLVTTSTQTEAVPQQPNMVCAMQGFLRSTLTRGWVPTLLRAGRGMSRYERAQMHPPAQPLQLWNYESNQFARL